MAEIITSILARSPEQVVRQARRAAMLGADWIELRLDAWPLGEGLTGLIAAIPLPVLVACRTREDGGLYRGTLTARRELLSHALTAGAQGIDLEQWEAWTPPAGLTGLRLRVRSFHSFTGVPKDLQRIRDELSAPGTVVKLVVTAHDLADAAPVFELLRRTSQAQQPTVAFAMGRTAWPTRVLSAALGAPYVYTSVEEREATAPGQPSVALLAGIHRVRSLGKRTRWFGLLGNPALHSLGPWLHSRAFRRLGLDALYVPLETSRPEAVVAMLPDDRLVGLSVTAPHKERMLALCTRASDEARAVGAVNTLLFDGTGSCMGHNTDVLGVRAALEHAGAIAADGDRAVVLGGGGAARAGAYALLQLGYDVTMLGRSLDPSRAFADANGVRLGSLSASVLDELRPQVVVHATPVGSMDRDPTERLVEDWRPVEGTIVMDMVYRPHRTRLLADAQACGAVTVPGVEMFLAQAAAQVRLFCGEELSIDTLRRFLAGSAAAERS